MNNNSQKFARPMKEGDKFKINEGDNRVFVVEKILAHLSDRQVVGNGPWGQITALERCCIPA